MAQPTVRLGALLVWLAAGVDILPAQTGSISGVVQGINFNTVEVYSEAGGFVAAVTQDNQETYQVTGLLPGNYYVIADSLFTTHVTQLYAGVACPLSSCRQDFGGGTLVAVTAGQETSGIDFQLSQGGGLTIRVATEGAGDPIPGARTHIYDAGGNEIAAGNGSMFHVSGLVPGTYFAAAEEPGGTHDPELFDNHPCVACAPTSGTPIAVNQAELPGRMIRLVDSRLGFFSVTPCRLVDTRETGLPLGGQNFRRYSDFSGCAIPPEAVALAVNVTAVNATAPGGLFVRAGGEDNHHTTPRLLPTVYFRSGLTRATTAIVSVARGPGEDVGFIAAAFIAQDETVDLLVDVVGYFAPIP